MHPHFLFGQKIEQAIRLLTELFPINPEATKPVLLHSLRVGYFLYDNDYPADVVLAGFLHDILEDTEMEEKELADNFGKTVLELVKANTKQKAIEDPAERRRELILRCIKNSQEAAIIKAADILDNYDYYVKTRNTKGVQYCTSNSQYVREHLPLSYQDKIFDKLFITIK